MELPRIKMISLISTLCSNSRNNLFKRAFYISDRAKRCRKRIVAVDRSRVPRSEMYHFRMHRFVGQLTILVRNYFPPCVSYLVRVVRRYCKFRCRTRGNSGMLQDIR